MRRWFPVLGVSAVLVTIAAAAVVLFKQDEPHPNVLIILWDTVRADRMSLYGHSRPTTPRLDAFAKEAVVYERATAPGMWTLNTHAAMFTGLYETSHGAKPAYRWLDQHYTTLAEIVRDAGYDTFFYSSNLIASPMTNLTQGFDTVHTSFPREGEPRGRYVKAAKVATTKKYIEGDRSNEMTGQGAVNNADEWEKSVFKDAAPIAHQALGEWLDERTDKEKPFFAYLNLMEAHTPRVPSMSARRRVSDDATIAVALATDISTYAANEYIIGRRDYTETELSAISATYDAAILDLDDATGDLLDDLRSRGLLDNTVVVVVADHGEHLGEHRRFEHRWSVYEPLLRVPLLIHYPKVLPKARVTEQVNTIDLYATLLDLTSLSSPEPTLSRTLVSRTRPDPFVFAQMLDPFASQLRSVHAAWPDDDLSQWAKTYCVVYGGHDKLIVASDGKHELYDLVIDSAEATDRAAVDPGRVTELLSALDDFEATLPVYDPSQRTEQDAPKGATNEERAMAIALGYVEDDETDVFKDFCGRRASAAGAR